jgi:hypothetical protein
MLTTIMKYVAIATLLTGMFWHLPPNPRSYLDFVITAAAVFVLVQAVQFRKYAWAAVFLVLACVFNPVQPIEFTLSVLVGLQVISAALFAVSLVALRPNPRMTIVSIIQANPRTESL